jgi:hypothetical protein
MKAERRHELQTNTLARFLENLPLYFRFHLGKILTGALFLVLLVMLIRYRTTSQVQSRAQVQDGLVTARMRLNALEQAEMIGAAPLEQRVAERRTVAAQIEALVNDILQLADGPEDASVRAEALIVRGDVNWMLGNLPPPEAATTQESLRMPQPSDQYLEAAQQAYEEVLRDYSDKTTSAITALFGLAAIAENRQQWDAARSRYDAILQRPDAGAAYKTLAAQRQQLLDELSTPIYLGTLTTRPADELDPMSAIPSTGASESTTAPTRDSDRVQILNEGTIQLPPTGPAAPTTQP